VKILHTGIVLPQSHRKRHGNESMQIPHHDVP
jgi:hypothetical protein